MDIMAIVNTMQPGTISRLALHAEDFPNGENGLPFMGVFVQLFSNKPLPSPADVSAYQVTYDAAVAAARTAQMAKDALPDTATQIANLTAAVVALGGDLPEAQITAANATLVAIGEQSISQPLPVEKLS